MNREQVVEQIAAFIRSGEKSKQNHKIGIEMEHFVVNKENNQYIHYFSEVGTQDILKALGNRGWSLNGVNGFILGASKDNLEITIEPGSQLEVSLASTKEVADLKLGYEIFLNEIKEVLSRHNYKLMYAGYNPVACIHNIPLLPKKRYEYMYDYFKHTGEYGHHMMKGTASLQIALDYENETDFNRKIKSAYWISPILYAAFDNVYVFEGKPNNQLAMRAKIWDNCDCKRCGIIKQVFDQTPYTYHDYAEIIADLPPIFIPTVSGELYTKNTTTHELIERDPELINTLDHFLGICFFDVRVKQYIELRVIDALSPEWSFAAAALIKNLLYQEKNLDILYGYALEVNNHEMAALQKEIMQRGMSAVLQGHNLWHWFHQLLEMGINESTGWEKQQIVWLKQQVNDQLTPRIYAMQSSKDTNGTNKII